MSTDVSLFVRVFCFYFFSEKLELAWILSFELTREAIEIIYLFTIFRTDSESFSFAFLVLFSFFSKFSNELTEIETKQVNVFEGISIVLAR